MNYNRYSYCLNNPLKYTDPDGEWFHLVIGAVVGGVINVASKGISGNLNSGGDFWKAFGVGAAAGALGAGGGGGISSALPITGQASGGFAAGFLGTVCY